MNKLSYNYGKPESSHIRINASGIKDFFSNTSIWFREKVLNEDLFPAKDRESAILGTMVHYLAEQYYKNSAITPEDLTECEAYNAINAQLYAPDIYNQQEISNQYQPMANQLYNYIDSANISIVEPFVEHKLSANTTTGGSIDGLISLTQPGFRTTNIADLSGHTVQIIDYKTVAKYHPSFISKKYKWQLLVYAYVLKQEYNITTDSVANIYVNRNTIGKISPKTNKRLKSYPPTQSILIHDLGPNDLSFIESIIFLISETLEYFINHPEQAYMLFQDYRLKNYKFDLSQYVTQTIKRSFRRN